MKKSIAISLVSALVVVLLQSPVIAQPAGNQQAKDPRCTISGQRGPCKAMFEMFYYNAKTGSCAPFFWGGCGEPKPFETKQECETVCVAPQAGLEINEMKMLDGQGLPYASVTLRYPKTWTDIKDADLTITLNGEDAPVKAWGGGFSSDWQEKTLLVFPGKAGQKELKVSAFADGKRFEARRSFDWRPAPMLTILDKIGDNELIVAPGRLMIFTFLVDDPHVMFNGAQVEAKHFLPATGAARLYTIDPSWKNGTNTLTVEASGGGKIEKKEYRFIYLADGTIGQGTAMRLHWGRPGSKSGPFYSLRIEGDAVVSNKSEEQRYYHMESDGWISRADAFVVDLLAVEPGTSTINVYEKPHFLQPAQLSRTIRITVVGTEK